MTPSLARAALLALACAALVGGCTPDDDNPHVRHYNNPAWTSDGSVIVAGYADYSLQDGVNGGPAGAPNLVVHTVATGAEKPVHLDGFSHEDRFWLVPRTNMLATANGPVRFFRFDGSFLGSFTHAATGTAPTHLAFDTTGASYLWGYSTGSRIVIGQNTFGSEPWNPTRSTVLLDTALGTRLLDIVWISPTTYAIHLSDGAVPVLGTDGDLIAQFQLRPRKDEDAHHTRLHVSDEPSRRQLYALDDSGIVAFDITRVVTRLIIKGTVINLSVSNSSQFILFETRTGDSWLATKDGSPLTRYPQHIMGTFSANGKSIAAVSRLSVYRDSLSISTFLR